MASKIVTLHFVGVKDKAPSVSRLFEVVTTMGYRATAFYDSLMGEWHTLNGESAPEFWCEEATIEDGPEAV